MDKVKQATKFIGKNLNVPMKTWQDIITHAGMFYLRADHVTTSAAGAAVAAAVTTYLTKHNLPMSEAQTLFDLVDPVKIAAREAKRVSDRAKRERTPSYKRRQAERDATWARFRPSPEPQDTSTADKAYKRLARQLHPDVGGSTEAMQDLNALMEAARKA